MKLGWPSASNNEREQFNGGNSEYKRCQSYQIIFKPSTHDGRVLWLHSSISLAGWPDGSSGFIWALIA